MLGFFDDVFERLPLPSLVAPLRRSVIEKIEHRDPIARAECLTCRRRAPSTTSTPGTAARFDVDGQRLCVVHIEDDFYVIGDRAPTPTTRSRRATCGRTSARSSARSTAPRSRSLTGEPQSLPATKPVPVYAVRIEGDDVIVTPPMSATRCFGVTGWRCTRT